jgi:hypothetical protein
MHEDSLFGRGVDFKLFKALAADTAWMDGGWNGEERKQAGTALAVS